MVSSVNIEGLDAAELSKGQDVIILELESVEGGPLLQRRVGGREH